MGFNCEKKDLDEDETRKLENILYTVDNKKIIRWRKKLNSRSVLIIQIRGQNTCPDDLDEKYTQLQNRVIKI